MSDRYIQLHNPEGDLLYPRTDWRVILNKPSFASLDDLATKQDKLTSANSGPGILIETGEGGLLRISATQVSDYNSLANKPSINNVTLQGNLTLGALGINYNDNTTDGAFELADESGNVALRVTNEGHLVTKEFNSENLPVALSQLSNDVGFITSAYHDPTKLDNTEFAINAALNNINILKYDITSGTLNLLYSDVNKFLSVDVATGVLKTYSQNGSGTYIVSFDSSSILSRITTLENNALTTITLGTALATGNYNISLFNNNTNYINSTQLSTALTAKQNKLNSTNAGANITITEVDGVVKINAITGGSSAADYNALANIPSLNGRYITGNQNASYYNLPMIEDTSDGAFELADGNGEVALRITSTGHLVTKLFNSENLPTDLGQFTNNPGYITSNYISATGSNGYLTSLTVNNITYAVSGSGGSSGVDSIGGATGVIVLDSNTLNMRNNTLSARVVGNPVAEGTVPLERIQIGNVVYSVMDFITSMTYDGSVI